MIANLFVNLARPRFLDIWSNVSLDVAVKVFLDELHISVRRL